MITGLILGTNHIYIPIDIGILGPFHHQLFIILQISYIQNWNDKISVVPYFEMSGAAVLLGHLQNSVVIFIMHEGNHSKMKQTSIKFG